MPSQSKGNPASHRMANPSHKAVRERGWLHAQARKKARVAAQAERERANKVKRASGEMLTWESVCADRAARRKALGLEAAWLKRQVGK